MNIATVSAGYFSAHLEFACAHGANREDLLTRADASASQLENPDNRIPLEGYITLTRAAKELTGDPALPLKLGANENFNEISVVGMMCYSAHTMAEGLSLLNRFGYLVAELDVPEKDNRFQIVREGSKTWMVDTRFNANDFPEMTEETWSRFVAETKRTFPDEPHVIEVHVTHAAPEHAAEYEKFMPGPVVFGSDRNALLIHESWLDIQLLYPNVYILGVLSEHAQKLLDELQHSKTTRAQVESLLIPVLHKGNYNMDTVAEQMNISRQTLYRNLKAEEINFEQLLDELREKMAIHYLNGQKASVNETAYLVGFADPSSFSRAFKRWTGQTPGSFRKD
ncbi:AraC family transcriptional regulator [Kordiimonas sp. SCSIO 12603]|uniref:AraC family transcriptional regulator n=1 Tax=Kordiimonas sp. SCSIO 12603 TaxID=2829596 RepID=UPI002107DF7C|nr:AraC family transcriptional regulator [Kordiimonas sp. SCSIO 12603]UTW59803.1 AraC family transcriptional regulator [Kordiimonas sp. SCSIO 12603]